MTDLAVYLTALGMQAQWAVLLDGGILAAIVLLMMFSKNVTDMIEEVSIVFAFLAWGVFGFWPWIILWILYEGSVSYRERNYKKLNPKIKKKKKEKVPTEAKKYI